ncbi:MAG: winged helix-turn-helix domain-containing protein [Bacteroidales bacterium]|nr:winged helix-turn-helix domain-containing protein [Bacteroidales bacterium]
MILKKSNLKSNQKILSEIRKKPKISIKELQEITNLSESGVKKIIRQLRQDNQIQRIGGAKGGYWQILEEK